ncbi:protein translocase subunit secB [Parasphingorhabdus marina DSM 22363]|uniref:Protein-export protein SecB n=1 Tax=Parasphingorhabdus marina DSM 22363 TaxID=1123272 RepID=A0A1N6CMW6_9SPHN|nr:protein-export chaperone SecB [Parasphingorhabdus marina]SIN59948.1 protein translocase subunit secB [Parasphingorhabdus marina DSM 22363]
MVDENGNVTTPDPATNGADSGPQIGVISQYVKDLSVENPNAPDVYQWEEQPQIDVQFNIGANKVTDEVQEVELKIEVVAKADAGIAFQIELQYCGLFGLRNVPDDQAHPFLFAEAPRLLFPFARAVIADAVRDAGFQPLMLEPIDFTALYMQQREQMAAQQTGEQPVGNA